MNDSFCVMPWLGLEIKNNGDLRPCCAFSESNIVDAQGNKFNINTHSISEYTSSQELDRIKNDMLSGKPVAGCKKCYLEESLGIRSMRVRKNQYFDSDVGNSHLKSIDVKLSNLCNQKCMICNTESSSMLASENAQIFPELNVVFNSKYHLFNWYKHEKPWSQLKEIAHKARHFDFYGGEPWLIKKQWEFIQYLVDNDLAKNISLNYATNGSLFEDRWFEEYFSKFKHVAIMFSADGVGDTFEYVRYPAKWDMFASNLLRSLPYRNNSLNISVAYTVSVYSIGNVIESLKYYKELQMPVWFSAVNEDEFSPAILPDVARAEISAHIHSKWQSDFCLVDNVGPDYFDAQLNRDVNMMWQTVFLDKTRGRDRFRNTDFSNILPVMKDYLQ